MTLYTPERFLSYGKQYIDDNDIEAVINVLKSDFLTQGPQIEKFEAEICKITNAKYCVAVSSGTAALHLSVAALNITPGKKGISSPITFAATTNALIYNNLLPDFVDIDENDYCICVERLKEKLKNDKNISVILPVHFAGQTAKMEEIYNLAKNKGIYIIEDAAHALGSLYDDSTPVGSCKYSDMTIFSFHPVKTITTAEGGAITTNDEKLYERLLLLRTHGITKNPNNTKQNEGPWYYEMQYLGFNYRITDIQAALGISQLKKLDYFVKRRKEIVKQYNDAFKYTSWLKIPYERFPGNSAFHLYVLQFDFDFLRKNRTQVMNILREKKIGTQVHYIPVYFHPYYMNNYGFKTGYCPKAENFYKKALSIPLFPDLKNEEINYIINQILNLEKL